MCCLDDTLFTQNVAPGVQILSSLCWSLALLVVIVSTFLSVDVAAFLELPGRAAFARAVLPITKALENMFVGVVLTFLLSFMLIGLIKTGFAVAFEPRYVNELGCACAGGVYDASFASLPV